MSDINNRTRRAKCSGFTEQDDVLFQRFNMDQDTHKKAIKANRRHQDISSRLSNDGSSQKSSQCGSSKGKRRLSGSNKHAQDLSNFLTVNSAVNNFYPSQSSKNRSSKKNENFESNANQNLLQPKISASNSEISMISDAQLITPAQKFRSTSYIEQSPKLKGQKQELHIQIDLQQRSNQPGNKIRYLSPKVKPIDIDYLAATDKARNKGSQQSKNKKQSVNLLFEKLIKATAEKYLVPKIVGRVKATLQRNAFEVQPINFNGVVILQKPKKAYRMSKEAKKMTNKVEKDLKMMERLMEGTDQKKKVNFKLISPALSSPNGRSHEFSPTEFKTIDQADLYHDEEMNLSDSNELPKFTPEKADEENYQKKGFLRKITKKVKGALNNNQVGALQPNTDVKQDATELSSRNLLKFEQGPSDLEMGQLHEDKLIFEQQVPDQTTKDEDNFQDQKQNPPFGQVIQRRKSFQLHVKPNPNQFEEAGDMKRFNTVKVLRAASKYKGNDEFRKSCMMLPEDTSKMRWDLIVTCMLMFTCFITPWRLAFYFDEEETPIQWRITNYLIDFGFFLDIIVNFNSAYVEKDQLLVTDRKIIAKTYLTSWFFVDLAATIPLDLVLAGQKDVLSGTFKGLRTAKLYKLMKLTRLIRILKVIKDKKKLQKAMSKTFGISGAVERLSFFVLIFICVTHITTCLWIITAKMQSEDNGNWIKYYDMGDADQMNLYIFSIYFTVTTITTVGYGDISAHTTDERIYCIFLMITGVIAFSFSSGALASLFASYDTSQKKLLARIEVLKKIQQKYDIKMKLTYKIQSTLFYDAQMDLEEEQNFLKLLTPNLRLELAMVIHAKTIDQLRFFRKHREDSNFISWVCPQLKPMLVLQHQYIFQEGDRVQNMYFQESGKSAYVMLRYENFAYLNISKGDHFGLMDIVLAIENQKSKKIKKESRNKKKRKHHKKDADDEKKSIQIQENEFNSYLRMFTVQAVDQSGLSTLSVQTLIKMQYEFGDYFDELFADGLKRLISTTKQKMKAIKHLEALKAQKRESEDGNMISNSQNYFGQASGEESPGGQATPSGNRSSIKSGFMQAIKMGKELNSSKASDSNDNNSKPVAKPLVFMHKNLEAIDEDDEQESELSNSQKSQSLSLESLQRNVNNETKIGQMDPNEDRIMGMHSLKLKKGDSRSWYNVLSSENAAGEMKELEIVKALELKHKQNDSQNLKKQNSVVINSKQNQWFMGAQLMSKEQGKMEQRHSVKTVQSDMKFQKAVEQNSEMLNSSVQSSNKKKRNSFLQRPISYSHVSDREMANEKGSMLPSLFLQRSQTLRQGQQSDKPLDVFQDNQREIQSEQSAESFDISPTKQPQIQLDDIPSPTISKISKNNKTVSSPNKLSVKKSNINDLSNLGVKSHISDDRPRQRANSYQSSGRRDSKKANLGDKRDKSHISDERPRQRSNSFQSSGRKDSKQANLGDKLSVDQNQNQQNQMSSKLDSLLTMFTSMSTRIDSLVTEVNHLKREQVKTEDIQKIDQKILLEHLEQLPLVNVKKVQNLFSDDEKDKRNKQAIQNYDQKIDSPSELTEINFKDKSSIILENDNVKKHVETELILEPVAQLENKNSKESDNFIAVVEEID